MTMVPDDASFIPEKIDAQVEQTGATQSTPSQMLLADLSALYATEAANDDALARVWQRIERSATPAGDHAHEQHAAPTLLQGAIPVEFDNQTPEAAHIATIVTPRGAGARPPQRRSWLGVAAVLLIVILGAAIFTLRPQHQPATSTLAPTTSKPSPAPQTISRWTALPALQYQAPYVVTIPAIAPTQPRVIYEAIATPANHVMIRRTDDGGATWHELPFPLTSTANVRAPFFYVDPLNAQTVYLQIYNQSAQYCPAGTVQNSTEGGQNCFVQFISTDAGNHWQLEHLPDNGYFVDSSLNNEQTIRAQGDRLYMMLVCQSFTCKHIVTSTDNGLTWSVADGQISNASVTTCDFAVSPTGATIYAITTNLYCDGRSTQTLYESVDAGAHWQRNAQLPKGQLNGMRVTAGADPTHPLLYLDYATVTSVGKDKMGGDLPSYTTAATDFAVSADGGKTWQHAPAQGIPANLQNLRLIGTLADGSIVGEFVTNANAGAGADFDGSTLFTWKAGASSWHQLGDATVGNIVTMLTTHTDGANDKIYLLTVMRSTSLGRVFVFQ